MLELERFSVKIAGRSILTDVSCCSDPGSIYGLVAPNGFGKTTFLKGIAGLAGTDVQGGIFADGVRRDRDGAFRRLVHYVSGAPPPCTARGRSGSTSGP